MSICIICQKKDAYSLNCVFLVELAFILVQSGCILTLKVSGSPHPASLSAKEKFQVTIFFSDQWYLTILGIDTELYKLQTVTPGEMCETQIKCVPSACVFLFSQLKKKKHLHPI